MPDNEAARWKARYQTAQDAYQKCYSAIARLEARIDAVEKALALKSNEMLKAERDAARVDRDTTRKRRFQEKVDAARIARLLRDNP